MIPIYIPSRKRAHQFKSEFCPIRHMDLMTKECVTYVVDDGEIDSYRFDLPMNIKIVEWRGKGIAGKRKYIGELARARGQNQFMIMDDDVKFFQRGGVDVTALVPLGEYGVKQMLLTVAQTLDEGYAHVGVSAREGNNNFGPCGYTDREENTRIMRVHAFWTDIFNQMEHCRVAVMEDFDVALQILEAGYKNANLMYYAQDQGGTQSRGGCADWRTKELHESCARELARLHPGLVKLREKRNKTGGDFGHRTEVTISWKKAFGKGVENARADDDGRESSVAGGDRSDNEGGAGEPEPERKGAGLPDSGGDGVREPDEEGAVRPGEGR